MKVSETFLPVECTEDDVKNEILAGDLPKTVLICTEGDGPKCEASITIMSSILDSNW